MAQIIQPKIPRAHFISVDGGSCAIAEGVTREDLLGLRAQFAADNKEFAKRHGFTKAEFDAMTNDELWARASRDA